MSRRRYDDNFRASAVVALQAAGYPNQEGALSRISKQLEMPHNTLRNWFYAVHNPPPAELRQEKKGELIDWINDELEAIFGELPNARKGTAYKELMTGAGILIDKRQLLMGEPTENAKARIIIEYASLEIDPT